MLSASLKESDLLHNFCRGVIVRSNLSEDRLCASFERLGDQQVQCSSCRALAACCCCYAVTDLDPSILWGSLESTGAYDSLVDIADYEEAR